MYTSRINTFIANISKKQLFIVALLAGLINVWTLGRGLNPTNLTWLDGDPTQYQAGFEFLRHQKGWNFPITYVSSLGFPLGVSIAYLDSIPPLAVLGALLSPILPTNFQYLGLFAALCHALQFFFGALLVSRFTSDRRVSVLSGFLFIIAPPLIWRLHGHYALMSHWVILASLYLYFKPIEPHGLKALWPHYVLAAIAASINPYIALFVAVGAGVDITQRVLFRALPVWKGVVALLVVGAVTLASLKTFGFLGTSATQFAGDGYTVYSMNLLSPFDPSAAFPSLLWSALKSFPEQYEGYNYLGGGTLFLLCLLPVAAFKARGSLRWQTVVPLVLMCVALSALAASIKVTAGQHVLFELQVPEAVRNALSAFRASGRLFWPVYYVLTLAGILSLLVVVKNPADRLLILSIVIAFQFADTFSLRQSVAQSRSKNNQSPLVSKDWDQIARTHRHLMVFPAWACDRTNHPGGPDAWYWFAMLAARNNLTINEYYTARFSPEALDLYCRKQPEEVFRDGPSSDTAVVLNRQDIPKLALLQGSKHYCREVDGFGLCTYDPEKAAHSQDGMKGFLKPAIFGDELTITDRDPRFLESGFSGWEGSERWTGSHEVNLLFRIDQIPRGNTKLTLNFSRVLVTDKYPKQRAEIWLNGHYLGTAELRDGKPQMTWEFSVPPGALVAGDVARLEIRLPDATTPKALGLNIDIRTLAVGIRSIRVSAD